MLCASKPGVVPMSHLRAKSQQTSGQRLYASHHFPAQVSEYPRPSSWDGGRSSNVQKMFQSCLRSAALPSHPIPPPPPLFLSFPSPRELEAISKSELSKQTGMFCRRPTCERRFALPLHLPSKAEHLGQGRFLLTDVHFRSGFPPPPFSLAAVRYRSSRGCGPAKEPSCLGARCGSLPSRAVGRRRCLAFGGEDGGSGIFSRRPSRTSLILSPTRNRTRRTNRVRPECVLTSRCIGDRGRDLCGLCKSHLARNEILLCRADPACRSVSWLT